MTNTSRPIRRLLVANRAEVARRVFHTARALGIETVAVASDADLDASWTLDADLVVPLGGSTPRESYLDIAKVLNAAKIAEADAIHPGYGFLAEDAAFAEAVASAGLIWVGPPPAAMRAMAGKVEAKRIAAAAGVPLVPGAEITSTEPSDWLAAGEAVGFPLLVKASAGGGGKGMRLVTDVSSLVESVEAAMREAASAFGDATVFFERFVSPARHIEVQVFADTHGNAIHLLDRECSVQRRHQKVVEECPAPALTDSVRHDIRAAAVALTKAIAYVGAGTVEFVVSGAGADQQFFFLEMNTRLQVEHPVTELVTETDLVAWQLAVATGATLPLTQDSVVQHGHAIEVRLYAEDPADDWMPGHGRLHVFEPPQLPALRVDTGVASGDDITTFYDPMLAKVVAHAPSRDQAAARLAAGLRRFTLHGPTTNRDALVAVLEHTAFLNAETTTGFFEDHPEVLVAAPPSGAVHAHLLAATEHVLLAEQHDSRLPFVPAGWRNISSGGITTTLVHRGASIDVTMSSRPDGSQTWLVDGVGLESRVHATTPELVRVTIDGVLRTVHVAAHGSSIFCDDGLTSTRLDVQPRFADNEHEAGASGPTTPVPGTITAVLVAVGDHVEAGDALVVLEAMKMEHRIKSDVSGSVAALHVSVGDTVDSHHLVAHIEPDDAASSEESS